MTPVITLAFLGTTLIIGIAAFVATIAALALTPKPSQPSRDPQETNAPTTKQGTPIPVAFGTVWVRSPGLVWFGDTSAKAVKG